MKIRVKRIFQRQKWAKRLIQQEGNTSDTKTFGNQIKKVAESFGGGAVTFVGDRGMIKGPQIDETLVEVAK